MNVKGANGKDCEPTTGMCSCCGFGSQSDPLEPSEEGLYLFKAGWCDEDGVFYSRLCGDLWGYGCIYDVEPRKDSWKEDTLMDLLGDDLDGMETMMEDLK
jgi:hypothetical protein